MPERVSVDQFDQLYAKIEHGVWRWEAQAEYHEPEEVEPFRRWRAGEPNDLAYLSGWLTSVRAAVDAGKRFERVRVCNSPPTTYQRWAMEVTPANILAGENIRVIEDEDARRLGLPTYDFCIFDDRTVARMFFDESGMTGAEISQDAADLARHCTWRNTAWQHAVPFQDYYHGVLYDERGT